jgi:hypothetical protein
MIQDDKLVVYGDTGTLKLVHGHHYVFDLHVPRGIVLERNYEYTRVPPTRGVKKLMQIAEIFTVFRQHNQPLSDRELEVTCVRDAYQTNVRWTDDGMSSFVELAGQTAIGEVVI